MQNGNASKTVWGIVAALVVAAAVGIPTVLMTATSQEVVTEHATVPHRVTSTQLSDRKAETVAVDRRVDVIENELKHIKEGVDENSGKLDRILRQVE